MGKSLYIISVLAAGAFAKYGDLAETAGERRQIIEMMKDMLHNIQYTGFQQGARQSNFNRADAC